MAMPTVWYFAYGSNMQPATFRGRRGIEYHQARAAAVSGWRIVFDKPPLLPLREGYANLVPDPGAETFGVLYEVTESDLAHVDLTEGVLIGNYRRIEIEAVLLDGATRLVSHTLVSDRRDPELRPSTRYMALLVEGAETHRLPSDWIERLRAEPTCAETEESARLRPLLDEVLKRR